MTDEAPEIFDLDDAISATVAALEKRDSEQAEQPDTTETPDIEAELESAKAEAGEAETGEAEPETDAGVVIDPPASWTNEAKEKFAALPPETQEYIVQRESERDKYLTETGQKYKQASDVAQRLEQTLEPYRHLIQDTGLDEFSALENLLRAAAFAQNDPQGYIKWLQSQVGDPENEADDVFIDPSVKQLRSQVQDIASILSTMQQQQTQRQQQAAVDRANAEKNSFASAKDAKGNPLHPHFEQVRTQMAGLLQSGAASDLASAYEQAVWIVPEVRAKMIEAEQKAKVAKAKAAAGRTVTPKAVEPTKPVTAKSWEETLDEVASQVFN